MHKATNSFHAFNHLFGPPPVLRSENREHYNELFDQYVAQFAPQDILELTLLTHLVEATWLIKRYMRHQTVSIERWYNQSLEFQAERKKLQNQRKATLVRNQADTACQGPPEIARLVALEDTLDEAVSEVDEILNRVPTELEHNRALERSILFQEQLNRLTTSTWTKFNQTLELFEHYREGLVQRLGRIAHEILEAEMKEIEGDLKPSEAPPLAPSNEDTHELGTQDSSEPTQQPKE